MIRCSLLRAFVDQESAVAFITRANRAVSSAEVHEFINSSGLIRGKQLRPADMDEVLQSLVYDARLEQDRGGGPAPSSSSHASSHGSSKAGGEGSGVLYRAVPALHSIEARARAFTRLPPPECDCPACTEISPNDTCHTMTAWLETVVGGGGAAQGEGR